MNCKELKGKISSGAFDKTFEMLYGEDKSAKERYSKAVDEFCKLYGDRPNLRLFSAPGRTEIGGNHTDHQHGAVIAASVDLDVIAVVSENKDGKVRIKSEGYPEDVIDINDLGVKEEQFGKAAALIRGVLAKFSDAGFKPSGFDAYTTSNVLKGSGLSSSAAFEVLVSNIVNGLFCENKVDAVTIAKYSQYAENVYFGKPSGLLDQMASSVGGFTFADFNDPSDPKVEKIDFDIDDTPYQLCVVDTGGNHSDLTQDYADITVECREISNALGVDFLRDADRGLFVSKIKELREKFGDRAVLRAIHFFNENDRVFEQKKALKENDIEKFLRLVDDSGESSYKCLQNLFPVSNAKEQGLSLAVVLTKQFLNGKGTARVHGGGFAGTIQCYVPKDKFKEYKNMIESVFGENSCVPLKIRPVGGYEIK